MSIRGETRELLAFDDPLGGTRCHLCTIPTDVYVPDMRFLFESPRRGLELVSRRQHDAN